MDKLMLEAVDAVLVNNDDTNGSTLPVMTKSQKFTHSYETSLLMMRRKLIISIKNRKEELSQIPEGNEETVYCFSSHGHTCKERRYHSKGTDSSNGVKNSARNAPDDSFELINVEKSYSTNSSGENSIHSKHSRHRSRYPRQSKILQCNNSHYNGNKHSKALEKSHCSNEDKNSNQQGEPSDQYSNEGTHHNADGTRCRKKSRTKRRRSNKNSKPHTTKYRCPKCKVVYILGSPAISGTVKCFSCDYWTLQDPEFMKDEKWSSNFCKIS